MHRISFVPNITQLIINTDFCFRFFLGFFWRGGVGVSGGCQKKTEFVGSVGFV